MKKISFLMLILFSFFPVFAQSVSETIIYSTDFEGTLSLASLGWSTPYGTIPLEINSGCGTNNSNALYKPIYYNQQKAWAVSPPIGPIMPGSVLIFDYKIINTYNDTGSSLSVGDGIMFEYSYTGGSDSFYFMDAGVGLYNHTPSNQFRKMKVSLDEFTGGYIYLRVTFTKAPGSSLDCFMILDNFTILVPSNTSPDFLIDPIEHDFGTKAINETAMKQFRIMNAGTQTLTINSVSLTNSTDFSLSTGNIPTNLGFYDYKDITVNFTPKTKGEKTAEIIITHNATGSPERIPLEGLCLNPPLLSISPTPIVLPELNIYNASYNTQKVIFENIGDAPLIITSISFTGGNTNLFSYSPTLSGNLTIQPNNNIELEVKYTPTAVGSHTTTFRVISNSTGITSTQTNILVTASNVNITPPKIEFEPSEINFGIINTYETNVANRSLIIKNTGNEDLLISNYSITGSHFTLENNFVNPVILKQNENYNLKIIYSLTIIGDHSANITFFSNSGGQPNTQSNIHVSAKSVYITPPQISVEPSIVMFSVINTYYTPSIMKTITISNVGDEPLTITAMNFSGNSVDQFSYAPSLSGNVTLQKDISMEIELRYSPTVAGDHISNFSITSNTGGNLNTHTNIQVSASNVYITPPKIELESESIVFKPVNLYVVNSGAKSFFIKNIGHESLVISNLTILGDYFTLKDDFINDITLKHNELLELMIEYSAPAVGEHSATLKITSNTGGIAYSQTDVQIIGSSIYTTTAEIYVEPENVVFDEINIYSVFYSTQVIRVYNIGIENLVISDYSITGSFFSLKEEFENDIILEYDKFVEIEIKYNPIEVGNHFSILTIISNTGDTANTQTKISISGSCVHVTPPKIKVEPESILFDTVELRFQSFGTRSAMIKNIGDEALIITNYYITEGYFYNEVGFTDNIILAHDDSLIIEIAYTPLELGEHQASLIIVSNTEGITGTHTEISLTGKCEKPSMEENLEVLPKENKLSNYPNPFNPSTIIEFGIATPHKVHVTIDIYNIKGQKVRSLVNGVYVPGNHSVVWNGRDDNANSVTSGTYFCRLIAGEYCTTKKMLLIK